jgi:S1-C subfamily serine protease
MALAVAALLAAALTGCTLGREPQARSAPAPVLAPKRAGRHRRHPRGGPHGRAVGGHHRPRPGDRQRVIWSKDGVVVTNNHAVRVQDQVVERVELDE